jgi:hypothetical protein
MFACHTDIAGEQEQLPTVRDERSILLSSPALGRGKETNKTEASAERSDAMVTAKPGDWRTKGVAH